uniref:Uncharacterized protein n=1 Tax=Chromera velia CCMP2878 TaxID=1169474 RepID=A0A0G4HV91_9ALVE|eukprot:Cvel_8805.t1-p1 / transcript=Cvel_8805.t1 / gene=Cvel_8805 / organism=Chromera_velia_CCMP2878 / gene_product=hypothetical protein / transcript_product=hypothetical protein / location=Cvel_scaffold493:46988-49675(+) / protein_length=555 / sequence_SO=supercontig / SO=protein_coding / is_pseudo=false
MSDANEEPPVAPTEDSPPPPPPQEEEQPQEAKEDKVANESEKTDAPPAKDTTPEDTTEKEKEPEQPKAPEPPSAPTENGFTPKKDRYKGRNNEVLELQGYSRYIWSKLLKGSHPFYDEYQKKTHPHEITSAYGDRFIPRLLRQLRDKTLPVKNRVHALRTLSDCLSDQEKKTTAIEQDTAAAVGPFLKEEAAKFDEVLRLHSKYMNTDGPDLMFEMQVVEETANVLRGLASLRSGRAAIGEAGLLPEINRWLIQAKPLTIRRNMALVLETFATARDGCRLLVDFDSTLAMAVLLSTVLPKVPVFPTERQALSSTLKALASCSTYDDGLRAGVHTGVIKGLVGILHLLAKQFQESDVDRSDDENDNSPLTITVRALNLLGLLGLHPDGREEAELEGVTPLLFKFLRVNHLHKKAGEPSPFPLPIVREATRALSHFLVALGPRHQMKEETIQQTSPYEILVGLLREEDVEEKRRLSAHAKDAILAASELPCHRYGFVAFLLKEGEKGQETIEQIYGPQAAGAVKEWAERVTPTIPVSHLQSDAKQFETMSHEAFFIC